MATDAMPPAHHSSIDLQVNVLRHIPTPIIVLSPKRKAVYVNLAAGRQLGSRDHIQSGGQAIYGLSPEELGIKLLMNKTWSEVLDKFDHEHKEYSEEGSQKDSPVHSIGVGVPNLNRTADEDHEICFQALLSGLTADDGMHYIITLVRLLHNKNWINNKAEEISSSDSGISISRDGPET